MIKTCTNGSYEPVTNLSMSLIGMLYNIQLMKYIGENGIWLSVVLAGFMSVAIGTIFLFAKKNKYKYL